MGNGSSACRWPHTKASPLIVWLTNQCQSLALQQLMVESCHHIARPVANAYARSCSRSVDLLCIHIMYCAACFVLFWRTRASCDIAGLVLSQQSSMPMPLFYFFGGREPCTSPTTRRDAMHT